MSLTAISLFESVRAKLFMNWTHNAISLFESVRAKLFMNSTHNMCKNLESNVFGLSRPK